eukprot:scaffold233081_cov28-Tisochrysis_lutea.AAC.3
MIARSARDSAAARILAPAPPSPIGEQPLAKAAVLAAPRTSFDESPVKTSGRGSSGLVAGGEARTPCVPTPVPSRPYTTAAPSHAVSQCAPLGNGKPIAPPTARPCTEIPTSERTFPSLPSTNSRVPSRGSTNMAAHRSSRNFGTSGEAGAASSLSSPTIRTPGHVACRPPRMTACAARSASVSADLGSVASFRSTAIAWPETSLRAEASTQVESSFESCTLAEPGTSDEALRSEVAVSMVHSAGTLVRSELPPLAARREGRCRLRRTATFPLPGG